MCGFWAMTYQRIVGIAKSEQILRWDTTCHISVSCWLFHTVLSTVSISYTYRTDLHRMPRPVTMYNWNYVWVLCHDISTYRRRCKISAVRWDTTCHISVSCWLFHTILSTIFISYTCRIDLYRMPRPVTMYFWIYVWVLGQHIRIVDNAKSEQIF